VTQWRLQWQFRASPLCRFGAAGAAGAAVSALPALLCRRCVGAAGAADEDDDDKDRDVIMCDDVLLWFIYTCS
jgi:hypothetical protein